MLPKQRIRVELSKAKARINALLGQDELTDPERAELATLTTRAQQLDIEYEAAETVDGIVLETRDGIPPMDSQQRERLELRSQARLTNYFLNAAHGRQNSGAELELQQAAHVDGIPLELFDVPRREVRVDTTAPTTGTGVNVDPVRPAIYAMAILPRLGVTMPRVETGGYATMTITAGLTAGATTAGAAFTATAATLTPKTTVPHRVTGRLSLRVEDIALIGVANFESSLRQNLMLVMSAELDNLGLTGNNTDPNPQGLYPQLTNPTDPTTVADFDGFVAAAAGGIDGGPWAPTLREVMLVVNPETYRLAETTFQSAASYKGEMSAGAYLRAQTAGFMSHARMPATVSDIAGGILYRAGTMGLDGVDAMRTAVCPMWDEISIDDIYSDSASGIRHFTMHNLIGDVLIEQASAYSRVDFKVS